MPAYLSVLTALGWSLLASFWQMALLWMACYLLTTGNKRFSAAGKHNLILLFIVFSGEWFIYTFFHLLKEPQETGANRLLPVSDSLSLWIPYASTVYLFILAMRCTHYVIQYRKRNEFTSRSAVSPFIQSFADRFTKILGITRRVNVFLCEKTQTAETSGFLKPLILLPFSLVTRLSPSQIEAILVHELYHIRRNDYLINIIATCYRSVFFFNPFAHLFYTALERERELACDDGVLELGYDPSVYAEALFSLEKYRQTNTGFSLAVDGKKPWLLMERIRRVLGKPALKEKGFSPMVLCGLAGAFIFFGLQFLALPGHRADDGISDTGVPVHYELSEEKNIIPGPSFTIPSVKKGYSVPSPIPTRVAQKKKTKEIEKLSINTHKKFPEAARADEAFYVDNNIVRNFSNESEAGITTDPAEVFQGSPYVPSASLSYEALPDNEAEDSIQELLTEASLKDAETVARLHSVINLKKLQREIENSNKELREVESKNKTMILLDQKNIQPLLNKAHQVLKVRKNQVEKMRIRLRVPSSEIIHI